MGDWRQGLCPSLDSRQGTEAVQLFFSPSGPGTMKDLQQTCHGEAQRDPVRPSVTLGDTVRPSETL